MAGKQKLGGRLVQECLERFPDVPTNTLAKKLYKENSAVWKNLEVCCQSVRYYRGAHGDKLRKDNPNKKPFRAPRQPGSCGFSKLPEGIVELKDWKVIEAATKPGRWAILSDVHVPYHDKEALGAIWKLAKKQKITGILLNGDIADCHAISRWQTDPRKRNFAGELDVLRQLFASLRQDFPKAEIIWKWGNHEERYDNYMQLKAPELLDVADFEYGRLARAADYGINLVKHKQPIKLGKLYTLHGHEFRGGYNNPVNPARGLYNKTKLSCIAGHLHQSSGHSEADIDKHITSCWSTGCLSDLRPEYAVINKWNQGAAIVEIGQDGSYSVNNYRIIGGECWS